MLGHRPLYIKLEHRREGDKLGLHKKDLFNRRWYKCIGVNHGTSKWILLDE